MKEETSDGQTDGQSGSLGEVIKGEGEKKRAISGCFSLSNPYRLPLSRFTAQVCFFPLECFRVHFFLLRFLSDRNGKGEDEYRMTKEEEWRGGQDFLASLERNEEILHLKENRKKRDNCSGLKQILLSSTKTCCSAWADYCGHPTFIPPLKLAKKVKLLD